MAHINWQRTRDILISMICIGVIVWFAWGLLFGQFVHAVVLLLLSLGIAFLLTPGANFLESKGIPRALATLLVLLVALCAIGWLGYALVSTLIRQVLSFSTTVTTYFNALPNQLTALQKFLVNSGIPQSNINSAIGQIQTQATDFARATVNNVLNLVFVLTNTLVDLLIILVLGFYFTVDGKNIRNNLMSIAPKSWEGHLNLFEDALNRVVGNYIRGQLTLALIIGVLAGGGCLIPLLGLTDYALIIGILAFLFETIPMVGPALASIPAILLSLLLPHPFSHLFWVIGYFALIQMIESNILGPRIVGHAVGLHPIASLLALIVGAQLFGAFGALLATPIVAAAWVVIASLYRSARGETADQMLARKRTAWALRRPPAPLRWGKKDRTSPTIPLPGSRTRPLFTIRKRPTMTVEHMDLMYSVSQKPNVPRDASEDYGYQPGTATPTQGSVILDHADLLRSITYPNDQQTPPPDEPEGR